MIINNLKPYCEGCEFCEIETETITRKGAEGCINVVYVQCVNYSMCAYLYKRFTEKVEK